MLRVVCVILALALQASAGTPELDLPNAATFRRVNAIEFYDFRLNASHDGGDAGVVGREAHGELSREASATIVDSTRWLEHPQTLFACS